MKSTVDWCEHNYVYSPHIAEYYNTISSLALVLSGVLGWYKYRRYEGSLVYILVGIVGVGSALFHAKLNLMTQMLDELPMIYMVLQLVANLTKMNTAKTCTLHLGATLYGLLMNVPALLFDIVESESMHGVSSGLRSLQFYIFQPTIIFIALYILINFVRLYPKLPRTSRRRFTRASFTFLTAWSCWLLDYFACGTLRKAFINPQLHAWWHILSAISLYDFSYVSLVSKHLLNDEREKIV